MFMGAIQTPGTTVEQVLKHYSALVQKRFADSNESLGELVVRKFASRIEPEAFYVEGEGIPFDKARFNLVMSNEREEWMVKIDLIFHSRKRLIADGSMIGAGIQFNVISEEDKGLMVDYFPMDSEAEDMSLTADDWCTCCFKKLARSQKISVMFAHKEFVRELEY